MTRSYTASASTGSALPGGRSSRARTATGSPSTRSTGSWTPSRVGPTFGSASTTATHPTSISAWTRSLERDLAGSFFVVAGRIGSRGSLDADGLRELERHGMTIGTHGMDHRPWRGLRSGRSRAGADRGTRAHRRGASVARWTRPRCRWGSTTVGLLADSSASATPRSIPASACRREHGAWLQPRFSVRGRRHGRERRAVCADRSVARAVRLARGEEPAEAAAVTGAT